MPSRSLLARAKRRKYWREMRRELVSLGICRACGKADAAQGFQLCPPCREKHCARMREYEKNKPEGLCKARGCKDAIDPRSKRSCAYHLAENAAWQRKKYREKKKKKSLPLRSMEGRQSLKLATEVRSLQGEP